jgi:hypothetical protein
MLNFEYAKSFTIHIRDKSGKVDWIWYLRLKNFKYLVQLKGALNIFLKYLAPDVLTKAYLMIALLTDSKLMIPLNACFSKILFIINMVALGLCRLFSNAL